MAFKTFIIDVRFGEIICIHIDEIPQTQHIYLIKKRYDVKDRKTKKYNAMINSDIFFFLS